jgi:hypothetical protein
MNQPNICVVRNFIPRTLRIDHKMAHETVDKDILLHVQYVRSFVFLSSQVQCHKIVRIDNRLGQWPMQLAPMELFQQKTFCTRRSRSIPCGGVQRRRGWRSLAAPLSIGAPWMWAHNHCDLRRSKSVRLFIDDDYTNMHIIQILHQFNDHYHSRRL